MAWEVNLPANVRRGVDVNVRKHPGGGLVVLVRIWPDVFQKLGWQAGHPVAVLEGGGEDAGKLMMQRDGATRGAHVRRLGSPGSGEAPGHLSIAVHWPAYTSSFAPVQADYELPDGEFEGALIVTMPAQPDTPPPAVTRDKAGCPRKDVMSAAQEPPAVRMIQKIEAETADAPPADSLAAAPAAAEIPAPQGEMAGVIAAASVAKGNTRAVIEALIQCREIGPDEFAKALGQKARDTSSGTVTGAIFQARNLLRGTGWHITALGNGRYSLSTGEDTAGRGKYQARKTGPRPRAPENHAKPPPATPPRTRTKIAAAADGTCRYMVVTDGAVGPCGAAAHGPYCEAHRVKTAPVPGFASGAGANMFGGGRRK